MPRTWQRTIEDWLARDTQLEQQAETLDPPILRALRYGTRGDDAGGGRIPDYPPAPRMARIVARSHSHFKHTFRQQLGEPYGRWARRQRVMAACRVIAGDPWLPLGDVTRQAGYAEPACLTRACQRLLGASPSQIRADLRVDSSPLRDRLAAGTTSVGNRARSGGEGAALGEDAAPRAEELDPQATPRLIPRRTRPPPVALRPTRLHSRAPGYRPAARVA